jgi:hypothetical protein
VNGTLTLLPLIFRSGADVNKLYVAGIHDILDVLGDATAQWTAKLSAGHTVSVAVLNDAMITMHCFMNVSAIAAGHGIKEHSDVIAACKEHATRVRERVLQHVDEDSREDIDVDDVCAQLVALLADSDAQASNKAKRTRDLDTEWRATDVQSALLNMLTHATFDLSVGANTAMDKYEEVLHVVEVQRECPGDTAHVVTDAEVDAAETTAVTSCMDAWSSVQALVEVHTAFVMNHVDDPTMKQAVRLSALETVPAVRSSLEAVLRGELWLKQWLMQQRRFVGL